jgi:hypothetical protein
VCTASIENVDFKHIIIKLKKTTVKLGGDKEHEKKLLYSNRSYCSHGSFNDSASC